jgi:hypothetical protein
MFAARETVCATTPSVKQGIVPSLDAAKQETRCLLPALLGHPRRAGEGKAGGVTGGKFHGIFHEQVFTGRGDEETARGRGKKWGLRP